MYVYIKYVLIKLLTASHTYLNDVCAVIKLIKFNYCPKKKRRIIKTNNMIIKRN